MKAPKLYTKFMDPDFKVVRKGKWYAVVPAVLIVLGIVIIAVWNFNLGLDFTGGTIIKISAVEKSEFNDSRAIVREILTQNGVSKGKIKFTNEGTDAFSVKYPDIKGKDSDAMEALNDQMAGEMQSRLHLEVSAMIDVSTADGISASASGERILNTFIAVIVALVGILLYMLFRFKLTSGISAIIGLIHDVLVMMALVAITRIQMNSSFIAALITVVGYSLNNTIVLFDRIREHEKDNDNKRTTEQICDQSIKDTIGRQMNTTITTLVPVFVLCIIGVPSIREFAIPILFGLFAGFFSSIFVTTMLYTRFENAKKLNNKNKKQKQLAAGNTAKP